MAEQQRVVVVTGVTRGLGRALVTRLIEAGHTVVGCGRSAEKIAGLTRQYRAPHQFDSVDVADDAEVARWARQVLDRVGPPDLLLNNAALFNANAPLWQVSASEFDTLLRVNLGGVANVIRHFVPAMIDRRRGVIVNFSSGWGRSTAPEVAPYCATKWGIEGLTAALAQELPDGMAAVALNPGVIDTDMLQSCFGESASNYPSPDEWSHRAAKFLLGLGPRQNGEPLSVR